MKQTSVKRLASVLMEMLQTLDLTSTDPDDRLDLVYVGERVGQLLSLGCDTGLSVFLSLVNTVQRGRLDEAIEEEIRFLLIELNQITPSRLFEPFSAISRLHAMFRMIPNLPVSEQVCKEFNALFTSARLRGAMLKVAEPKKWEELRQNLNSLNILPEDQPLED